MMFRRYKEWRLRAEVDRQWRIGVYDGAMNYEAKEPDRVTANAVAYGAGYMHGLALLRAEEMRKSALSMGFGGEPPVLIIESCPDEVWERIRCRWLEHFS